MQPQSSTKAVDCLNDLIEVCENGAAGYARAGEILKEDRQLTSLFSKYGSERSSFADRLKSEVEHLGGKPKDSGTIAGAAHRAWFDVKTTFSSNDRKAVINEVERGEDHALEAYREASKQPLIGTARMLVQDQLTRVADAHDKIRGLKHEYERA